MITLEQLAPYLPYELKGLIHFPQADNEICTLHIKNDTGNIYDIESFLCGDYIIKPILRPLSDLTKEIEYGGEKFIPLSVLAAFASNSSSKEWLADYQKSFGEFIVFHKDGLYSFRFSEGITGGFRMKRSSEWRDWDTFSWQPKLWSLIYQWHFDVFGLIDKGLAINYNLFPKIEV